MTAQHMLNDPVRMRLYELLVRIRDGGPVVVTAGICYNVVTYEDSYLSDMEVRRELTAAFKEWPEYSGDQDYPVVGGQWLYEHVKNHWDSTTPYGAARLRLLDFLIDYFE